MHVRYSQARWQNGRLFSFENARLVMHLPSVMPVIPLSSGSYSASEACSHSLGFQSSLLQRSSLCSSGRTPSIAASLSARSNLWWQPAEAARQALKLLLLLTFTAALARCVCYREQMHHLANLECRKLESGFLFTQLVLSLPAGGHASLRLEVVRQVLWAEMDCRCNCFGIAASSKRPVKRYNLLVPDIFLSKHRLFGISLTHPRNASWRSCTSIWRRICIAVLR